MKIAEIESEVDFLESMAKGSKLDRLKKNPLKYLDAVVCKRILYKITKRPTVVSAPTIYGKTLIVPLPACTDIYLCKGKSHHSEIALVKYLLKAIQPNHIVIDIGAHVGYFALLIANLTSKGTVYAFEPSSETFYFLEKNAARTPNLKIFNRPLADKEGTITFYQFEGEFSEYSTFDIAQYQEELWFKTAPPPKTKQLNAFCLNNFCETYNLRPDFIKLDAEGGEALVLKGGEKLFNSAPYPTLAMEYLHPAKSNKAHHQSHLMLSSWQYKSHLILENGDLTPLEDPEAYMIQSGTDSLNLIYRRD